MNVYTMTYNIEKKEDSYNITRSVDKTLPISFWGIFSQPDEDPEGIGRLEEELLKIANEKIKKSFKVEIKFHLPD